MIGFPALKTMFTKPIVIRTQIKRTSNSIRQGHATVAFTKCRLLSSSEKILFINVLSRDFEELAVVVDGTGDDMV